MTTVVMVALLLLGFGPQSAQPAPSGTQQPPPQTKKTPKKPPINPSDTGGARGMGLLLRGSVVDPGDAAVASAAIHLTDGNDTWETTTDLSGRFEFRVSRAGSYTLEIIKDGFRTTHQPGLKLDSLFCSVRTRLAAGSGDVTVPFVELRGRVRDQAGEPVSNAQLEFTGSGATRPVVVATDSDGDFRVPNFQSGSYDLRITAEGFKTHDQQDLEIKPSAGAKPVSLSFELRK